LTANTDRQPKQPISSPPSDGPIAIVAPPAIAIPPKTLLGGASSPASAALRRISIIAVGYPADVPNPINTRAHTNIARWCDSAQRTADEHHSDADQKDAPRSELLGQPAGGRLPDGTSQIQT
jgi:hypothetical protein